MNDTELMILLGYAAETWVNYPVPTTSVQLDMRLQVWRDHLGDLDAGVVRAVIGAAADREFALPVGEIRRRALRLSGAPLAPDADEAIAEIFEAVRAVGMHRPEPDWTHPAIADTVRAFGGWLAVCTAAHPESERAHLLRLYGVASKRHERAETLSAPLAALLPSLDSDRALGPPAESVSALRSPVMEDENEMVGDRDDDAGMRAVDRVRDALDAARRARAEGAP